MIDRCDIDRLKSEGRTQKDIARILGFHPSTVSRELNRKGAWVRRWARPKLHYNYGAAQDSADEKLEYRRLPRRFKGQILHYVLEKLAKYWSPEQIASRIEIDTGSKISHETIYRFIHRDKLRFCP
jgi:IS30 family transposase